MKEQVLDDIYTALCASITAVGESHAPLFLARFALLASERISDVAVVESLIAKARESLESES
jgi:hypothetical protein